MILMKLKNTISRELSYLNVFLGVVIIIYGVSVFYAGEHNVDLSFNMGLLANQNHWDFYTMADTANDGNTYPYTQIYSHGLGQMEFGLYIALAGVFGVTTGLSGLSNMVGRKDL